MKRVLLDTCVIYPTVMRAALLAVATRGGFRPLWSERILEEWARASVKLGPEGAAQARSEIAVMQAQWPKASVQAREGDMRRLHLPDPNDIHVFAAAVAGSADAIMTLNRKDFPNGELAAEGLERVEPDGFLMGVWLHNEGIVAEAVAEVAARAKEIDGFDMPVRRLLKKARLPRLAKALG